MGLFFYNHDQPAPDGWEDRPPKKGAARYWEIVRWEWLELFKLNLLFLLFCLPLLTIPAALTAFSRLLLHTLESGHPRFPFREFWGCFRREFPRATLVGWGLFLWGGAAGLGTWLCLKQGGLLYAAAVPCFLCLAILVTAALYFFPILATVDLGVRAALKNAVLLAVGGGLQSLLALGFLCLLGLLFMGLYPLTPALLPLGYCSFGGLLIAFPVSKNISRFVVQDVL